jgi:hypothetical protein
LISELGSRTRREAVTFLSICALLLQAMLFAWHHHTHLLLFRDAAVSGSVVVAKADPASLSDDDCQICFALSHYAPAPVDFFSAPLADHDALLLWAAAVTPPRPSYLLFRSRAPPWA